jgi:hypothetical protein
MERRRCERIDSGEAVTDHARDASPGAREDDATVRLLRAAGPRAAVSPERAARVRAATRAAWQTHQRRRVVRHRVTLAAAAVVAAALVLIAGRMFVLDRGAAPPGAVVAVVDALEGSVSRVQVGSVVAVGQWIETGPASRVALRFGRESSVRLDVDSRLRALSSSVIELASGAVYVDSGEGQGSLEVRTPFGIAFDIGTQFEVRLLDRSLRLRVRTGLVELRAGGRSISARRGTEVTLSPSGAVTRPLAAGADWEWIARVSRLPEMEGVPLATFLSRVAREQGWSIEYSDAAIARAAQTIVLHGEASGLTPQQAVEAAIATSGLQHAFRDGTLVVGSEAPLPDKGDDRR